MKNTLSSESPRSTFFTKAVWNPSQKMFVVEFAFQDDRHIEIMTEERFFLFCDKLDEEIQIAGWNLHLVGADRDTVSQFKDYYRMVRASYVAAKKRNLL